MFQMAFGHNGIDTLRCPQSQFTSCGSVQYFNKCYACKLVCVQRYVFQKCLLLSFNLFKVCSRSLLSTKLERKSWSGRFRSQIFTFRGLVGNSHDERRWCYFRTWIFFCFLWFVLVLAFFFFFASQLRFRTAYVLFFLSPYSQSHSQHSRHAVFIFTKCCFSPCTHTPGSLGYLLIGAYLRSKFLTSIHSSSPIRPCDQTGRRWISRIKARLCFGNPVVGGAARCENSAVIQAKPR